MRTVNLALAKAQFSELVAEAENGGEVLIERRGKPAARLVPPDDANAPLDLTDVLAWVRTQPLQQESGGDFVRRMRDDYRY